MSRGGRGGGRGGRGGAGAARGKIGGVDVTWEDDPEVLRAIQKEPTGMFPDIRLPTTQPASRIEKTSISRYRALRSRIHEGPLYTVLGTSIRDTPARSSRGTVGVMNPFEGMRTYAQKFQRKRYKIPKLDTRPYVMHFFPQELWTTLDSSYVSDIDANVQMKEVKGKRKRLDIFKATGTSRLEEVDAMEDEEEKEPDEEEDPEEEDDDFGEDESEDDDYNAEAYFDDGEREDFEAEDDNAGDTYD